MAGGSTDQSQANHLNKNDWKQWFASAWQFLLVPAGIYAGAVSTLINMKGHTLSWNDFIPTESVLIVLITWFLMQIQGLGNRYRAGDK